MDEDTIEKKLGKIISLEIEIREILIRLEGAIVYLPKKPDDEIKESLKHIEQELEVLERIRAVEINTDEVHHVGVKINRLSSILTYFYENSSLEKPSAEYEPLRLKDLYELLEKIEHNTRKE